MMTADKQDDSGSVAAPDDVRLPRQLGVLAKRRARMRKRVRLQIAVLDAKVLQLQPRTRRIPIEGIAGEMLYPINTQDANRRPIAIDRTLFESEVSKWRYHHCEHYERCLDDAVQACANTQHRSYVCAEVCPGRKTYAPYKELKLSELCEDVD